MELQELVAGIRKFDLVSERLTQRKLAGLFNSTFHGQGWTIDHVRRYEPGDSIRDIEWNVTARLRETFVKTFSQEKERLVWILLDVSRSVLSAANGRRMHEVALMIGATLAFCALESQDQVGLILYSDRIEQVIPPARGKVQFWRIARELVSVQPQGHATDTAGALKLLLQNHSKSSLVFLISDFISGDYAQPSHVLAQQHELVAIRIRDECTSHVPRLGWVRMQDAESGYTRWLNTSSASFSEKQKLQERQVADQFQLAYQHSAIRSFTLDAQGSYMEELVTFLQQQR